MSNIKISFIFTKQLQFQYDYQYLSIFKVHVSVGTLHPYLLKHRDKFSFKLFLLRNTFLIFCCVIEGYNTFRNVMFCIIRKNQYMPSKKKQVWPIVTADLSREGLPQHCYEKDTSLSASYNSKCRTPGSETNSSPWVP